jgi:hypothetical protein
MPAPRQTMTSPRATRAKIAPREVPEDRAAKNVFIY